jgi:hypothetical protein
VTQRTALTISTAFTVLILLAALGLSVRVLRADVDAGIASNETDSDAAAGAAAQDRQSYEYVQRLQESNDALAASFRRQLDLLDELDRVRAENALFRERERLYQERLAEANLRLRRLGQEAGALPPPIAEPAAQLSTTRGSDAEPLIAVAGALAFDPQRAERVRTENRTPPPNTVPRRVDHDEDHDRSDRPKTWGRRSGNERD